jgi:hypothetical protein
MAATRPGEVRGVMRSPWREARRCSPASGHREQEVRRLPPRGALSHDPTRASHRDPSLRLRPRLRAPRRLLAGARLASAELRRRRRSDAVKMEAARPPARLRPAPEGPPANQSVRPVTVSLTQRPGAWGEPRTPAEGPRGMRCQHDEPSGQSASRVQGGSAPPRPAWLASSPPEGEQASQARTSSATAPPRRRSRSPFMPTLSKLEVTQP